MADRVEPLYVLYGSQMGNSEQAAKDFCEKLEKKYTLDFFRAQKLPPVQVSTTCLQLDDFLEMHHAAFSKCVVIFVSSYGVGQAPMGAYRFRDLCDAFSESDDKTALLEGLKYAICGLGDSTYPTYLKNPTSIDAGLTAAGGRRVGAMGKADAHAKGEQAQDKAISKWIDAIWVPLAKELCNDELVDTKAMQSSTIPLLKKLDPDYTPPKDLDSESSSQGLSCTMMGFLGVSLLGAVTAIVASKMQ